MKKTRVFGVYVLLMASLLSVSCARTGHDSGQQHENVKAPLEPLVPTVEDSVDAQCGAGRPAEGATCSEEGSIPSSAVEKAGPMKLTSSRLSIEKKYVLDLLIDKKWQKFVATLADTDLTGKQMSMSSDTKLKADLTCLNSDCSQSKVLFVRDDQPGKTAALNLFHYKMRPLYGEIQINCETPVFFDYELDELLTGSDEARVGLDRIKRTDWVYTTVVHAQDWEGNKSETIRVELFVEGTRLLSLSDPVPAEVHRLIVEQSRLGGADRFSYGLVGSGESTAVSFIKAHFPLKGGTAKELCYNLPLIPEVIEW